VEQRRHWWQRSLIRRASVRTVAADEFVTIGQACEGLDLKKPWVNHLGHSGHLVWCTPSRSGPLYAIDVGVTRESFDHEVAWWDEASADAKRSRKIRLLFHLPY
jgi:hypothetical protein